MNARSVVSNVALTSLLGLGLAAAPAWARPGVLDPTFGDGGVVTPASTGIVAGFAEQSDGKIVVISDRLTRYDTAGHPDATYGAGGSVMLPPFAGGGFAYAALPGDGLLIVAGSVGAITVTKYDATGALDAAFASGGVATVTALDTVFDMAVQPDDAILLAGAPGLSVVRLDADGTLDLGFGSGGLATNVPDADGYRAIALAVDGTITVAATKPAADGGDFVLTRFDASGAVDPSFGTAGVAVTDPLGAGRDLVKNCWSNPTVSSWWAVRSTCTASIGSS